MVWKSNAWKLFYMFSGREQFHSGRKILFLPDKIRRIFRRAFLPAAEFAYLHWVLGKSAEFECSDFRFRLVTYSTRSGRKIANLAAAYSYNADREKHPDLLPARQEQMIDYRSVRKI